MMSLKRLPICNNNPSSAPTVLGKTFFFCWRCTGAIIGLASFLILNSAIEINATEMLKLGLLFAPATIDYMLNKIKLKKPNNILRFVTGVLLGVAVGVYEIAILYLVYNIS